MPLPLAAIGAGASLIPTVYQIFAGASQRRKANRMNPVDPNYQMNTGVLQNREIASNNYGNYQMPGFNRASNRIGATYGATFENGVQGASSGGDVLDLASKMAYGQSQALSDLEVNNAQGKQQALGQFMDANALAGQEQVNSNAYDRQRYQGQLNEKAALLGAANQNVYSGIDSIGSVAGSYLNPKRFMSTTDSGQGLTPDQIVNYKKKWGING